MEVTAWLILILAMVATGRGDDDALAKGRGLLLRGKYEEAAEIVGARAGKEPAAALVLARCLSARGKLDEAVATLSAVAEGQAGLQAELARLAFDRGDYAAAKARADEALRLDADQLLARWIHAEVHRTAGRLDEAQRLYSELIGFYNNHAIEEAESLRWIGLAAARYAGWNRMHDQFHLLVGTLYPKALKLQPGYWPAHYEAGLLFLEKHNQADASRELMAALELNPDAAEVHVALARLAIDEREIERAQALTERALEINPRLLGAWLCRVDLAWANFDVPEAERLLRQKALPLNGVDESTLGRLAACYWLLDGPPQDGRTGRFTDLVDEVTGRNPHAGEFFCALADQLAARHRHAEAEAFFRRSIEVMPRQVGPQGHLGLLYMLTGQDAEARTSLGEAIKDDPFNVRVKNSLEVLDVIESMETLDTEHFRIRYDAERDKLLARRVAEQLEAVYPVWCERFGYRPPGKPLVEIFNRARGLGGQKWFSTRLTGLPYVGTVAASTGRLIAMVSPNEPEAEAPYHWARVLKHELVHVITLQQTQFNIPHWYTEGLAVDSEGRPRPQRWTELLFARVAEDKLFHLGTLNFGFTRPTSGDDCALAYCQAGLYVEYMLDRWGTAKERKLLAAYAEGLTTGEAIRRTFGVSQEEFERGYLAHVKKLAAETATLEWPSGASFAKLLAAHRGQPNDADAAAELAYAYLRRKADREALDLALVAMKLRPKHPLAAYVLARLELKVGHTRKAIALLQECLDRRRPQPNLLGLLAGLQLRAEQYDEAAELYALGQRLDSVNLRWTKALARVYLLSGDQQKLTEALTRLARADVDDLPTRKKLAQLALEEADYVAAADWANQALQIDVRDEEMLGVLAEVLVGRHDDARAVETLEALLELAPGHPGAEAMLQRLKESNQP